MFCGTYLGFKPSKRNGKIYNEMRNKKLGGKMSEQLRNHE